MKTAYDKKYYFFSSYLFFVLFILSSAINFRIGILSGKIFAIIFLGMYLFKDNAQHKINFEKASIVLFVGVFAILMLLRGKMPEQYVLLNILECIILVIIACTYFIHNHYGVSIRKWVLDNKWILFLILCFVLLSVEVINSWLMWDAWQYYTDCAKNIQGMVKNFDADFSGVYNLYLADHAALGYSLWLVPLQLLKEGTASVQITDIVLAAISIYAYYQILRKLLKQQYADKILALATIPYAFSPFVLGIIGNINLDSATMYFSIIFVACSLYHYECLELIFAFLFCFTKETAVIYYFFYVISKIICEYCSRQSFSLCKLVKCSFSNVKNYMYALPAILWIILFKSNPSGAWGGEASSLWNNSGWNCFGINFDVITAKLKQILFINFNWIFWLVIIVGIVIILIKKIRIERQILLELLPICIMGATVIIVGCMYITYILPRYIVPAIPVIYLTAAVIISHFTNKPFFIWSFVISILLIIQSFYVIDPVMNIIFASKATGYGCQKIYKVGNEDRFDDHVTYNRQNIYWSEAIKKVLKDTEYNGNMLIVFPDTVFDAQYELLGNWRCLWNMRTESLEYFNETTGVPEQCKWLDTCYASNTETVLPSTDYKYILYIVPGWDNADASFIRDQEIIKKGEVNHKGYNIQYMVMNVKHHLPLDSGNYLVSPKSDESTGISTDGTNLYLQKDAPTISVSGLMTKYNFIFDEYQVAMDVQYDRVDENGTVWVWEINRGHAQQWSLEEIDGYYMICYENYALTYDLNNSSLRLTPKTGDENQQWSLNSEKR